MKMTKKDYFKSLFYLKSKHFNNQFPFRNYCYPRSTILKKHVHVVYLPLLCFCSPAYSKATTGQLWKWIVYCLNYYQSKKIEGVVEIRLVIIHSKGSPRDQSLIFFYLYTILSAKQVFNPPRIPTGALVGSRLSHSRTRHISSRRKRRQIKMPYATSWRSRL